MTLSGLRKSGRRLRTLMLREVRATLRDPFTIFVMISVPLGSLMAFGYIVSTEIHGIRLGVFDGAASALSRRLVAELAANDTFEPIVLHSRLEVEEGMIGGRLGAALIIPADFERSRLRSGSGHEPAEIQVFYDGAEPVLAGNAAASLGGIVESALTSAAAGEAPNIVVRTSGIRATVRPVFNPTLDGRPYMVAGTFGFVLTFLTTLITAISIVNERLTGTYDQLQLTPATPIEILLGKMVPLGAVFSFDLVLMMLAAGFVLETWPVGSALLFWLVATFYVGTSLAMGLFFSATSATPAEAVQKTVLSSIPLIQLSGFIYPVRSMPDVVGWVSQLIPATHFIEVSRAIYLRGEGIADLWPRILVIVVMGFFLMAMALRTLESRS
ncbi:MAG: ABC transporter permease [Candidatus Binatia bacterium]